MTPWLMIVLIGVVLHWLAAAAAFVVTHRTPKLRSRAAEVWCIAATLLLAGVWTAVAPPWNLGSPTRRRMDDGLASCSGLRPGMSAEDARAAMGKPTRIEAQGEVRGAGAEAWIYEDGRCIAHLFGGRIEHLEYEGDLTADAPASPAKRK